MLAAEAESWHKRTMEPELDLDQASRGTLLVVIAEQHGVISELRQRVESLEARLSGDGPGARMPGHKLAARGKKGAGGSKEAPEEASTGLCPAADGTHRTSDPRSGILLRMPYCPERGLGAADPGGHRTSGESSRSYRTRLHRPDVSAVPETEAAPGPPPGSGRGPAAVGDQPGQPVKGVDKTCQWGVDVQRKGPR